MTDWKPPTPRPDPTKTDEVRSHWYDFWGGAIVFVVVATICALVLTAAGVL